MFWPGFGSGQGMEYLLTYRSNVGYESKHTLFLLPPFI